MNRDTTPTLGPNGDDRGADPRSSGGVVMDALAWLGWGGCVTGLTGAALLALKWRYSAWGWLFFLISNVCWIGYAYLAEASHIELQHIGFMATSLVGVYRWLWVDRPRGDHDEPAQPTPKESLL